MFQDNRCLQLDGRFAWPKSICRGHLRQLDTPLTVLRKGDARKKVIAWLVRRKTAVKNEWISSRLYMGNVSNLSRYVAEVESSTEGELHELKNY